MRPHFRRSVSVLAALVALAPAVVGAAGTAHAQTGKQFHIGDKLTTRVLTPDGADRYSIRLHNGVISMSAPTTNTGGNLRVVFWPTGEPSFLNGQVCATWVDQSSPFVQEGVALRIVTGLSSRVLALTVDKNVIYGIHWYFHVVTWDTATPEVFTGIGGKDMGPVVTENGEYIPFPWRVCARVIGSLLTFKVWVPAREGEPSWTDAVHTGTATVPSEFTVPGKAGWYVGHIPSGGSAHYSGLGIWRFG